MNLNIKQVKDQLIKELNQLKTPQGFLLAGFPHFNKLFGRDSLIVSWQLLNYDVEIVKNTLEILSKFQGVAVSEMSEEEPGKILHEHIIGFDKHSKGNWPFPYYGSIDSTLLYLILFYFYFNKTKDADFIKQFWANIEKAVDWILNYGDRDNDLFIEYKNKNPNGLYNQGWKDSNFIKSKLPIAIVEVQGYEYFALVKISELIKVLNINKEFLDVLKERADKLQEKFNQNFWMDDKKYFALGLDGDKKQIKYITSNPGHLLFTEIVDNDKIDYIVKKLFSEELWTEYGIRTHSIYEENFNPLSYHLGSIWPHDNWIIAQGLKKLNYLEEYNRIKSALLNAFKTIGYLPEYYGVINNEIKLENLEKTPDYPQAWSSGALLNFILEDEK
ncbi:MAG: hypothetical protein KatS3mg097_497 [Candidatus Parcubacteria bacterium]|nr:MAG: hypothetical protein KatS3mg097_497 [Candidatus Parcubacteria bacterium]